MRLLITNWEKYNPRGNAKKGTSWYRQQRDFFRDSFVADELTLAEKAALIYVFCECKDGISDVSLRIAASEVGCKISDVESLIQKLVLFGKASVIGDPANPAQNAPNPAQGRAQFVATDGRTDGRNGRTDGTDAGAESGASSGAKPRPPSPADLADLWNHAAGPTLARVQVAKIQSGTPRYRHAKARLDAEPDLGYWRGVIERVNASAFCRGDNDRGWKADFDWLVKPESACKALEGKYDDRDAAEDARRQATSDALAEEDRKARQERQEAIAQAIMAPKPPEKPKEQREREAQERAAKLREQRLALVRGTPEILTDSRADKREGMPDASGQGNAS